MQPFQQANPFPNQARDLQERAQLARQSGQPEPFIPPSMRVANLNPNIISDSLREYEQTAPPTPLEEYSGMRLSEPRSDLPTHEVILDGMKSLGKGFVTQFNPFEEGISGRERLFRSLNVASLAIPVGWIAQSTRLGVMFPAIRAMAQTARGRIGLQAVEGAIVNGSLEMFRHPEERGEHGVAFAVAAGLAGGAIGGKISEALVKRRNRNISSAIHARIRDVDTWKSGGLDATGDWTILPHEPRGWDIPRTAQVKVADRLHRAFEEAGFANEAITGQWLRSNHQPGVEIPSLKRQDMTLVSGLNLRQSADVAKEMGIDMFITNRGLVDVGRDVLYPMNWSKVQMGRAVDAGSGYVRIGDGFLAPAFDMKNPLPLPNGLKATAEIANLRQGLDELIDRPGGTFNRMWQKYRDVDSRMAWRRFYSDVVNGFAGGRELDKLIKSKTPEQLNVSGRSGSLAKIFQLMKAKPASYLHTSMRNSLMSWDGTRQWTHTFRSGHLKGQTATSYESVIANIHPEDMVDFEHYGFARRWLKLHSMGEAVPSFVEKNLDDLRKLVDNAPAHFDDTFVGLSSFRRFFHKTTLEDAGLYKGLPLEAQKPVWDYHGPTGNARIVPGARSGKPYFLDDPDWVPLTRVGSKGDEALNDLLPSGDNWKDYVATRHGTKRTASTVDESDQWVSWLAEDIRRMGTAARVRGQHDAMEALGKAVSEWYPMLNNVKVPSVARGKMVPWLERIEKPAAIRNAETKINRAALSEDNLLHHAAWANTEDGLIFQVGAGKDKVFYRTESQELQNLIQMLGPDEVNTALRIASLPAHLTRAGVVLSPDFMAKNIFRDVPFTFINAGMNPMAVVKGIASVYKQDAFYEAWANGGGLRATLASVDLPNLQQLVERGVQSGQKVKNVVKHPFEALSALGNALEATTRLGLSRRKIEQALRDQSLNPKGMSATDIVQAVGTRRMEDIIFASRDGPTDFGVVGGHALAKVFRMLSAFWSPALASADTVARHAINDPIGVGLRGSLLTMAGMTLWALNRQKPYYVNDIEDWEKQLFWHVEVPFGDEVDDPWIRIPKPFEYGLVFSSMPESFLRALDENDPGAGDEMAAEVLNLLTEGFMLGVPDINIARPWLEYMQNETYISGAPVTRRGLDESDPRTYNVDDNVSLFAREFTNLLNRNVAPGQPGTWDPQLIDHVFESYAGTLGRQILQSTDDILDAALTLARKEKLNMTPGNLMDHAPIVGSFLTNPNTSQALSDFYALNEWVQRDGATVQRLTDNMRVDEMSEWTLTGVERGMPQAAAVVQSFSQKIYQLQEARRAMMMTGDYRGAQEINRMIFDIAAMANNITREAGFKPNKGLKSLGMGALVEAVTGVDPSPSGDVR